MEPIHILLLRPDSDDPAAVDQSLGARLAATHAPQCAEATIVEASFHHRDLGDLEKALRQQRGAVSAVVGATGVPESTRLGELADTMGLLCFVANNNPVVWQHRRHVFHIGLPSSQTAAAVAAQLQRLGCKRIALVHDRTEFQRRVAASMESAMQSRGAAVQQFEALTDATREGLSAFHPELVYVVFSSEEKALPVARAVRALGIGVPLLFGRSLMRRTFLDRLEAASGELWFVDMFSRLAPRDAAMQRFFGSLEQAGVSVPTANHAFGWDGMSFCAQALRAAGGAVDHALDYLQSGVEIGGVTGSCRFSRDNHNGRSGSGPTVITRWRDRRFEDV
ncbi:MAG: ABC transporter substrate-binding protein [Deltaproteobacteria bacterium]|nr:ABC transporter substrate-binding protein [Deltaproteobacteria bacterium]